MRLSKELSACPVVALEVLQLPSHESEGVSEGVSEEERTFVLAASGPNLLIFTLSLTHSPNLTHRDTDPIVFPVFDSHSITAVKHMGGGTVIVLGYKALTILQFNPSTPLLTYTLHHISSLRDLVLDARIVRDTEQRSLLLIGYAQNFLDIYSLDEERVIATVKCPVVCVLFSLAIAPLDNIEHDGVTIASGTAMGQIVLWTAGVELSTSSAAISSPPPVCVSNTLSGHKGIIWKVRWNTAKDRIVSVSDDRTVRVWDVASGDELFCGFGHICRVWDAMFVGKGDKAVVTCGEDAVVKLWDVESQKCVMTMQGHANKHIWCVNMLQITNNCTMDSVLLSGGNDCCVNLWPVSVHTLLNAEPQIICQKEASTSGFRPQVSTQEQLCARWQAQLGLSQGLLDTTSKYSHMLPHWDSSPEMVDSLHSKPFQTVIAHRMSSCGSLSILITQKSIWMIDLESNDMQDVRDEINDIENVKQEIGHDKGWNRILCTDKQINAADAVFVTNGLGDWSMDCCCVHPEGYVTLASWQYSSATNVGQKKERSISSLKLMEWKGHQRNSMNVSFLPTGCGPGDKYGEVSCAHNAASLFLTMSVQGECKIWKKQLQDDELMISQELECRTAKCNIATSAALLCESKCVAIGDCRGNVSLFRYETEPTSSESSSVAIGQGLSVPPFKDTPCFQFIPKAHGLEIVSCIQAVRGGFCSLGYDGYLSVFSFNPQDPPHCFYLTSRLPCTPIASPDQMFCTYDRGAEDNWSLIVAGYQASDFIIYDIRKKYQLLKISAGGWKRAHRAALNFCDSSNHGFPDVAFIYSAMIESRAVYNCMRYKVKTLVTEHGPVIDSSRLPMQLGSPSLGKVAYCATFLSGTAVSDSVITQPFLAVGAEDGTVKVFSYYNESDVSELSSSPPKSTYYRFEQEVQMPSNVAARAIFHCRPRDCPSSDGILIAAGGRLMFSIWRYRKPDINSSSPLGCVLEQVYASNSESCRRVNKGKKGKSEKSNSAGGDIHSDVQDHRILATAALPLAGGSGYVIMFCDSRGMVKVIRLAEQQNLRKSGGIKDGSDELIIGSGMGFNVTDEIEFTASSYPLLSCVLLSFGHEISTVSSKDDDFHLGIVGNTHGGVSVWVLSTSTFNNR